MSKTQKKADKPKSNPAQFVIDYKQGPVIAKVWLVDGFEGNKQLKYSLLRYYLGKNGNWIERKDYFGRNKRELLLVIEQASSFCDKYETNPEAALEAAEAIINQRKTPANDTGSVAQLAA